MIKHVCKRLLPFVGGMIAASAVKSNTARKLAVNTMAKGMEIKDNAQYGYNKMRDEAENIYEEAKLKAKAEDAYLQDVIEEK